MEIVFLVEEPSMKYVLLAIVPKILPADIRYRIIAHEGKGDLEKSIPIKLKGWNIPNTKFVILHDQDMKNCKQLKMELIELCKPYHKEVLIRIPCKELEAWYFGDLEAVSKAYEKDYTYIGKKQKFRIPDQIADPRTEIHNLIPQHEQISGAKKIGPLMNVENNTSESFRVFVEGLRKFAEKTERT